MIYKFLLNFLVNISRERPWSLKSQAITLKSRCQNLWSLSIVCTCAPTGRNLRRLVHLRRDLNSAYHRVPHRKADYSDPSNKVHTCKRQSLFAMSCTRQLHRHLSWNWVVLRPSVSHTCRTCSEALFCTAMDYHRNRTTTALLLLLLRLPRMSMAESCFDCLGSTVSPFCRECVGHSPQRVQL